MVGGQEDLVVVVVVEEVELEGKIDLWAEGDAVLGVVGRIGT